MVDTLAGNYYFSHSKTSARIFHVWNCSSVGLTNFWSLEKTQKKSRAIFPDFSTGKNEFWVVHQKRLNRKFWNNVSWIPNKTCSMGFSGFVTVMFSVGEISRRPNEPSSSHLKNNVVLGLRIIFPAPNWTARNKNFWVQRFSSSGQKTLFQNYSIEPFWMDDPKLLFSGRKILEDCKRLFWLRQWPKFSQTNIVAIKNTENWGFCLRM